ncbi:CinA family protein [Brachybacterium sp. GCM10030252]|uniref:CinA family protein n=1 Tax=Brachybacterium sp. GCM10030252 TaxID=3273380 RepID=UPI00360F3C1C
MTMASDPAVVIARAAERGWTIATAESLTAGAVVARLVDVPGASAVVAGGAACYSYDAKTAVLGVDAGLLRETGAVTAQVASAMAEGALELYGTDLAVATTGVAGPGPDERGVAEGTVVLGLARRGGRTRTRELHLSGGRARIRAAAVEAALDELAAELED